MASAALTARIGALYARIRNLEDAALSDEERIGLDDIRGEEDLEICMKFSLEVYYEAKTESVWAAQHPREYERLQRIAGAVPLEAGAGQTKSTK